jgi:hypothetical protein
MARMEVVQVQCDRCKRVELLPANLKRSAPMFEAKFGDNQTLVFQDLCAQCLETSVNTMKILREWDRAIKHHFGPTMESVKAPPLTPAPDYSPPKPHSGAHAPKK